MTTNPAQAVADLLRIEAGRIRDDYETLLTGAVPLIDVRAPVEFAKGAFPSAVNLPLMNDDERHLVGIEYKQADQHSAIQLGATLLGEKGKEERTRAWAEFVRANPGCALYCFRGGLRSRIAQRWLLDAGLDVPLISGGYKSLRRYLIDSLERLCRQLSFVVIGGRTGTGKTTVLGKLEHAIDLEQLAHHRGSSFGRLVGKQPGNIDFENALTIELLKLERQQTRTVFLEDEARLIGRVCLPDTLRDAMQRAPLYIVESTVEERIDNCLDDYVTKLLQHYQQHFGEEQGWKRFAAHHRSSLERIRKRLGGERYRQATALLDTALEQHRQYGDTAEYRDCVELLLKHYYDPMYDYQLQSKQQRVVFTGSGDELLFQVRKL